MSLMILPSLINDLDTSLALKTLGSVNYFLGFEAYHDPTGVYLTQTTDTSDLLLKAGTEDCKPCSTPFTVGVRFTDEGPFPKLCLV